MYGPAVKDVRPWKDITYVETEYVYIYIYLFTEKSKIERTQRHIIRYIFWIIFSRNGHAIQSVKNVCRLNFIQRI